MKDLSRLCKTLLEGIPALVARVGDRIEYSEDPEVRDVPKVAYTLGTRRPAGYGLRSFYIYPLTIHYIDTIDDTERCHDMEVAITAAFNNYAGVTVDGQHVKWINFISSVVEKYTESKMQAEILYEVHANL